MLAEECKALVFIAGSSQHFNQWKAADSHDEIDSGDSDRGVGGEND
ncbi:unnamed protein product [Nezara viridula]|uniref:Uncharacterized protein n=1 Tax=Nezara viridula TaxID=85310 RepID=A0A9P0HU88_NEZVI|nr:unnamed protein product [Nezara viridula]